MFKPAPEGDVHYRPPAEIDTGLKRVFTYIDNGKALKGLDKDAFADKAADVLHEVYAIHPFREGNTRTSQALLWRMGQEAGYEIRPEGDDPRAWRAAFISGRLSGDERPLRDLVRAALDPGQPASARSRRSFTVAAAGGPAASATSAVTDALAGLRLVQARRKDLDAAEAAYRRLAGELKRLQAGLKAGEEAAGQVRASFDRLYAGPEALVKFNAAAAAEGPDRAVQTLRERPQRFGKIAAAYRDEAARAAVVAEIAAALPTAIQARADARRSDKELQRLEQDLNRAQQARQVAAHQLGTAEASNPRQALIAAWTALPRAARGDFDRSERDLIRAALQEARDERRAARAEAIRPGMEVGGRQVEPSQKPGPGVSGALQQLTETLDAVAAHRAATAQREEIYKSLAAAREAQAAIDGKAEIARTQLRDVERRLPQIFRDPDKARDTLLGQLDANGPARDCGASHVPAGKLRPAARRQPGRKQRTAPRPGGCRQGREGPARFGCGTGREHHSGTGSPAPGGRHRRAAGSAGAPSGARPAHPGFGSGSCASDFARGTTQPATASQAAPCHGTPIRPASRQDPGPRAGPRYGALEGRNCDVAIREKKERGFGGPFVESLVRSLVAAIRNDRGG